MMYFYTIENQNETCLVIYRKSCLKMVGEYSPHFNTQW